IARADDALHLLVEAQKPLEALGESLEAVLSIASDETFARAEREATDLVAWLARLALATERRYATHAPAACGRAAAHGRCCTRGPVPRRARRMLRAKRRGRTAGVRPLAPPQREENPAMRAKHAAPTAEAQTSPASSAFLTDIDTLR